MIDSPMAIVVEKCIKAVGEVIYPALSVLPVNPFQTQYAARA